MNITLSVDEATAERAREVARQQGTSLNALIREYIEKLAGMRSSDEIYQKLQKLWAESPGKSGGYRFHREDAYEGRGG